MSKAWQHALLSAYRPMQLRGMMVEGQYRLPKTTAEEQAKPKRRMLLVALIAGMFRHRSKGKP